jgi:hypothetical protein
MRELDQTTWPFTLPPMVDMADSSLSSGFSSLPLGAPPPMVAQPQLAKAQAARTRIVQAGDETARRARDESWFVLRIKVTSPEQ